MFELEYKSNENLPKLAWIAEVNKKSKKVTVLHGKCVECNNGFFVAGVWDGNFEVGDFDKSSVFWGTGAKCHSDKIMFVTPSHTLERLVLSETDDSITISNSLPFLLSYENLELDPRFYQYEKVLCSLIDGPKKHIEQIPLKDGKYIRQFIASVIEIDDTFRVSVMDRPQIEPFTSFNNYYERMMKAIREIKDNAESIGRKTIKYGILSTISSGYDSSACAAIAKKVGCKNVVTLMNGKYDKDSGEDIAKQLGYDEVIKRDCNLYKQKTGLIDAEYVCSGELGTQLQFSVFEDLFANNIVFYGCRGSYWDKGVKANNDYEMNGYFFYEADVSWTENALRNAYINAPIPAYGTSQYLSINDITNSKEMAPWTLGTNYDKPIPRRILEESGVKRNSFGTVKYGGGFSLCYETKKRLKAKMSAEGYESFRLFEEKIRHERRSLVRILDGVKYFVGAFPTYWNVAASRIGLKCKLKQNPLKYSNPGTPSDLIFWSVDVMKKRYNEAIKTN